MWYGTAPPEWGVVMRDNGKVSIKLAVGLTMALLSGAAAAEAADPAAPAGKANDCFYATQWRGWKSPSADVIYIRVGMHDVYRIDLSAGSPFLQAPGMHLVSKMRGSDMICSVLDLDLKLSDSSGIAEPLIAKSIAKMTPEEAAAIPEQYRP
jgi:hypothetical protein